MDEKLLDAVGCYQGEVEIGLPLRVISEGRTWIQGNGSAF